MAEIAILRRVREEQERQQLKRNRRRPKKDTALLLSGVVIGGYLMYNGHQSVPEPQPGESSQQGRAVPEGRSPARALLDLAA